MIISGYEDEESIIRNHFRFLKDIQNSNDINIDKKIIANALIEKAEKREIFEVRIYLLKK